MQQFFIRENSVNPILEMELINDGRYDFQKSLFVNDAIQDSVVTFSMINEETGLLKVSKSPCNIVLANDSGCEEKYILQYVWKARDVNTAGTYRGWFEIKFNGDIYSENAFYPEGNLIVPVEEDLQVIIKK